MDRQHTGRLGEQLAADYLKRNDYDIIDRNFGTRFGEIDIIAKQKNTIIFVEVKTRSGDRFGTPEEAITKDKQKKLRSMAEYFLLNKKPVYENWQIDVIGIELCGSRAKLRHLKNAVEDPET